MRCGCLRYVLCALPPINRGASWTVQHSVALLKVYRLRLFTIDSVSQAHTARSGCSSALGYALRSNPNSTIAASPMLDKSLVNAYGEPVHTHSLSLHLPRPSGSQEDEFLPYRRQTALRSVAADEPHALLYGSTFRAKYHLRWSRGKDTRTTLPPICGSFHSRFLLQLPPTPTSAYSGREV